MPFTQDMEAAALRHGDAAQQLDRANARAEAAYLFGLAAECAVKAMMLALHVPVGGTQPDPYYAHFPSFKTAVAPHMQRRGASVLARFVTDTFLSEWNIAIRYAASSSIVSSRSDARYERWKRDAESALSALQEFL